MATGVTPMKGSNSKSKRWKTGHGRRSKEHNTKIVAAALARKVQNGNVDLVPA